jgi:hypothetical protein
MLMERSSAETMRLRISGGATTMDQITKSLLKEFIEERDLTALPESKQFEHFCSYGVIRKEYSGTLDTMDLVVGDGSERSEEHVITGSDTGIDAIGIVVNGVLVTDADELVELEHATYWDVKGGVKVSHRGGGKGDHFFFF